MSITISQFIPPGHCKFVFYINDPNSVLKIGAFVSFFFFLDSKYKQYCLSFFAFTKYAKKYRETIQWERLEISSRKLEIPREHFKQRWTQ